MSSVTVWKCPLYIPDPTASSRQWGRQQKTGLKRWTVYRSLSETDRNTSERHLPYGIERKVTIFVLELVCDLVLQRQGIERTIERLKVQLPVGLLSTA